MSTLLLKVRGTAPSADLTGAVSPLLLKVRTLSRDVLRCCVTQHLSNTYRCLTHHV